MNGDIVRLLAPVVYAKTGTVCRLFLRKSLIFLKPNNL
jgi:hypothetical protein